MSGPAAPQGMPGGPQGPINMRVKKSVPLAKKLQTAGLLVLAFVPLGLILANHFGELRLFLWPVPIDGPVAPRAGSLGADRLVLLVQISSSYTGPDAAERRRKGELAPAEYLNRALIRRNLNWRVRSVAGPYAETYEVS